jgi:hypothetical protein
MNLTCALISKWGGHYPQTECSKKVVAAYLTFRNTPNVQATEVA